MQIEQDHKPIETRDAGKWYARRFDHGCLFSIITPDGQACEIHTEEIAIPQLGSLLSDMLDGLLSLQNENAALRERDALRDRAEGQAAFDVVARLEAEKAARAAEKAGFEAVIWELREDVAALKGVAK